MLSPHCLEANRLGPSCVPEEYSSTSSYSQVEKYGWNPNHTVLHASLRYKASLWFFWVRLTHRQLPSAAELSALGEETCYWKERQYSHLMDPGCHRPTSASLRTSEVDHNPKGLCVPASVVGVWAYVSAGRWAPGKMWGQSVYKLSLNVLLQPFRGQYYLIWAHPSITTQKRLDITLFQEKERN